MRFQPSSSGARHSLNQHEHPDLTGHISSARHAASLAQGTRRLMNRLAPQASTKPSAKSQPPQQRAAETDKAMRARVSREERQRLAEVFASSHVHGREETAAFLIVNSDASADVIVATLAKLPATAAESPMLRALMGQPNPALGAGSEAQGSGNDGPRIWDKIHGRSA